MSHFHPSQAPDYYLHVIKIGLDSGKITQTDADMITRHVEEKEVKRKGVEVKPIRKSKIAQTLVGVRPFLKCRFADATKDDILKCVKAINRSKYSQNTRNDFIRILKGFYFWGIKEKLIDRLHLEDLTDVIAPGVDTGDLDAKSLITRDEVGLIIKNCKNIRDRALIAVIFESAARVSEIARMKWGDIEYTDGGIVNLTIYDEKRTHIGDKPKKRHVPLLFAIEYLAAWRSSYPGTPSDDALVFIDSVTGGAMEYRSVAYQISRAAKRAGITKRVNPHIFRKSRLTEMTTKDKFSDAVVREIGWANQSTSMAKVYIKLGQDDVMREFMERAGIKKPEDKPTANLPRQCGYCHAMNVPSNEYCRKCGAPLTQEAQMQVEQERGIIRKAGAQYVRIEDVSKLVQEEVERALSGKK